jgi:hypothetical protein
MAVTAPMQRWRQPQWCSDWDDGGHTYGNDCGRSDGDDHNCSDGDGHDHSDAATAMAVTAATQRPR